MTIEELRAKFDEGIKVRDKAVSEMTELLTLEDAIVLLRRDVDALFWTQNRIIEILEAKDKEAKQGWPEFKPLTGEKKELT